MHGGQRAGIFSCKRRLMPIVIVVIEEGHEPHAPFRRRYTIGPSISASSTLPPSAQPRERIQPSGHNAFLPSVCLSSLIAVFTSSYIASCVGHVLPRPGLAARKAGKSGQEAYNKRVNIPPHGGHQQKHLEA